MLCFNKVFLPCLFLILIVLSMGWMYSTYLVYQNFTISTQNTSSNYKKKIQISRISRHDRVMMISPNPGQFIKSRIKQLTRQSDVRMQIPQSLWVWIVNKEQISQEQLQKRKISFLLNLNNNIKKKSDIFFINDFLNEINVQRKANQDLGQLLILFKIHFTFFDFLIIDTFTQFDLHTQFMSFIREQFTIVANYEGLTIAKNIPQHAITSRDKKQCQAIFSSLLQHSTSISLPEPQMQQRDLILSPRIKTIFSLDPTHTFPTISKPLSTYLSYTKTNKILIHLNISKQQQKILLLRTILSLIFQRNKAHLTADRKDNIEILVQSKQYRTIVQRNLIINDLEEGVVVGLWRGLENGIEDIIDSVVVCQFQQFGANLGLFRTLLIQKGVKVVVYFDSGQTQDILGVSKQFAVFKINDQFVDSLKSKKITETSPKYFDLGFYLIHKKSTPPKSEIKSVQFSHSNKYGIEFINESGEDFRPLWYIKEIKTIALPNCFTDNKKLLKYFYSPTDRYQNLTIKINDLFVNQPDQQMLWCLQGEHQMFYWIGICKQLKRMRICEQVGQDEMKLLIKIAILNDFGGKMYKQNKQNDTRRIQLLVIKQQNIIQRMTSPNNVSHVLKSQFTECKGEVISGLCFYNQIRHE